MKIKNLLLLLFAVISIIVGTFALITYENMVQNNFYVKNAIEKGIFFQKVNDDTRFAQVNFQRQVQEWKDTLLRGNNPEMFDKYFGNFKTREAAVDKGLSSVAKSLRENGNDKIADDIDVLLSEHAKLGVRYREALVQYDKSNPEAYKVVDVLVKGMDRPSSQAMDKVSEEIKALTETTLTKSEKDLAVAHEGLVYNLIISTVLVFVFVLLSALLIQIKIMKIIGLEPSVLNQYFEDLAKGNFKSTISVSKKDNSSVAFKAKMMQFKLKNLIVSIKNSTDEINSSADSAKITSTLNEVQESLRKTKNCTRGLKDTVNKFNI